MNHLSGLDATFLHLESPEMPMHVGSLCVLDLSPGDDGDDFFEYAKQRIVQRMHLADVFTRKLALMPFDLSNPVWVDDEDIDIDYHVRHVTLPQPGTNRLLQQYVARLHSSLLDRSRPLWEFFIIDGLKSGQVALYTKAHHAGMDGQAGMAVAQAIFDLEPTGRVIKPPSAKVHRHRYHLGMAELGRAALRNTALQVIKLVQTAPTLLRTVKDVVTASDETTGKRHWGLPQNLKLFGPRTMLNTSITNQRTFAGRTISLTETKYIGKTFGGTLNDVVMTTTAGALRRYLQKHGNLPDKSLLVAIPVSLREAGDKSANNQVSLVTSVLGTDIADPVQRLAMIHEASEANKRMMNRVKTAVPTDFPLFGAPWLISGVAAAVSRSGLLNSIPPISNLIISNVPGSPVPLYFAGAKLASFYPVSIVVHSMALNVTVQSYAGRLDYGLIACRRALPDVADLGDYLLAEHQELLVKAHQAAGKTLDAKPEAVVKVGRGMKKISAKAGATPPARVQTKTSRAKPKSA